MHSLMHSFMHASSPNVKWISESIWFSCKWFRTGLPQLSPPTSWFWVSCTGVRDINFPWLCVRVCVPGERSLYCLNQNGVVLFMKKLEVGASCVWAYQLLPLGEESAGAPLSVGSAGQGERGSNSSVRSTSRASKLTKDDSASGKVGRVRDPPTVGVERGMVRSMLATQSGQLLVMQDDALIWTASLHHMPVHLTTVDFTWGLARTHTHIHTYTLNHLWPYLDM